VNVDPASNAEEIVCDTSFVSVMQRAARNETAKTAVNGWPQDIKERLDQAILGISVISLAELRSGYAANGWSEDRIASRGHCQRLPVVPAGYGCR
jgi:hypothetical protein